jgi:hypothetical protein
MAVFEKSHTFREVGNAVITDYEAQQVAQIYALRYTLLRNYIIMTSYDIIVSHRLIRPCICVSSIAVAQTNLRQRSLLIQGSSKR